MLKKNHGIDFSLKLEVVSGGGLYPKSTEQTKNLGISSHEENKYQGDRYIIV